MSKNFNGGMGGGQGSHGSNGHKQRSSRQARWSRALAAGLMSTAAWMGSTARGDTTLNNGGLLDLTLTASTANAGLSGRLFTGITTNDTALINFTNTAASLRIDTDFSSGALQFTSGPLSNTAVQWIGKLNITDASSPYTFYTSSDDGSRIYIDGVLVLNNDGGKAPIDMNSAPITLTAGLHDIRVDYVNNGGGGSMELAYAGPDSGFGRQVVPSTAIFQAETNTAAGASNAVAAGTGGTDALTLASNATATVNLNGSAFTQAQFGALTLNSGSKLNLTALAGKTLRASGTTALGNGAGGTVTIASDANVQFDGVVTDGGVAVTLAKMGTGRLVFNNSTTANSLLATSTLDIQNGTLVAVGSSAAGSVNPLGSAKIRLSGGNFVIDSKIGGVTYTNAIDVTQNATIQDIATASTTTLSGAISIAAGKTLTLDAIAGGQITGPAAGDPGATLVVSGPITGNATTTLNLTSSLLGSFANSTRGTVRLTGNNSGFSGTVSVASGGVLSLTAVNNLTGANVIVGSGGSLTFNADGNGTGSPEALAFNDAIDITAGNATLTAGRLGTTFAPLFTSASNKRVQLSTLAAGANVLTVNNNNGYGIEFTGATTLTGTPTFTVATATPSNLIQGLTLAGQVSGSGGLIKLGAGTLALTGNSAATLTGNLTVNNGVLAASSDSALGAIGNQIILAPATTGNTATFRATGDIDTARVIAFGNSNDTRAIEVSAGKKLRLTSAFDITASINAPLVKNDQGTLELAANNSTWDGSLTINRGVVLVTNADALGNSNGQTTVSNFQQAALQVAGNINVAEPVNLSNTGFNSAGALQNLSGNNTWSGQINLAAGASIGSTAGTLTITGGINGGQALTFAGAGNLAITTNGISASSITKIGTGTVTLSANSNGFSGALTIYNGSFKISGDGQLGSSGAIGVQAGGTLTVDDTGTAITNRLGNRPLSLQGSTFNYIANTTAPSNESAGILTLSGSQTNFNVINAGAQNSTLTFTSLSLPAQSSANFSGVFGTGLNKILFNTAPGLTNGVLAHATVNGTSFATYDATNGITAFAAYNDLADINTSVAANNVRVTAGMTAASLTASRTANTLTLTGAGPALTGAAGTLLTIGSGGVLVAGGANSVSANVAFAGNEGVVHVNTGASLNMTGAFSSTIGLTKGGSGTLTLGARQNYTGVSSFNAGTIVLAGGTNTIVANNPMFVMTGATLDLNGNSQYVSDLYSSTGSVVSGSGGIVTGASPSSTLVANYANARTFAGSITGGLSFAKAGSQQATLNNANTFSGATLLNAGILSLQDTGTLANTSSITIGYTGQLQLDNSRLTELNNRLNDAAPITLNGGTVSLFGRAGSFTSENLGAVTVNQGTGILTAANGSNVAGYSPEGATLTLASFNRNAAAGATTVFGQTYQTTQQNTSQGNLGLIALNGASENVMVTGGIGLTNNIVGGWGIVSYYFNTTAPEFASYNPTYGVGALNTAGFAGYDGTALPAANNPAGNYRPTANMTVPSGGLTINSLNVAAAALTTVSFTNAGDALNLVSGGFLQSGNFANAIGTTALRGKLTSGGSATTGTTDLYLYNQQNTLTVNSIIADNGLGAKTRLVAWGGAFGAAPITLTGNNTYTGGTVVNQQTLILASGATLPGNTLIINGGTVTQQAGSTIASTNDVTLNGSSVLTLGGNQTLANLTFNNNGGSANPTVNAAGALNITSGVITASSSNVGSTATLAGRADFGAAPITFNVNPITFNGTDVAPLQATFALQGVLGSGTLTKTGAGILQLNNQDIFTGALNVTAGSVQLGLANAGSRFSALSLATGTRLNLNGFSTTLGSLSGPAGSVVTNTGAAATLTVGFDNTNTTFSGAFSRNFDTIPTAVGLTKIGAGTLTLDSAQSTTTGSTGALTVNGGTVRYTGAGTSNFASATVNGTGALTLDNTATALNNRLGLATVGTLTLNGGSTFNLSGNGAAAVSEAIATLALSGGSTINVTPGAGGSTTLAIGAFPNQSGMDSVLIRGTNVGAAPGAGVSTVVATTLVFTGTQGAGAAGTKTISVRPDVVVDTNSDGIVDGFGAHFAGTGFRALDQATELANSYVGSTPTTNIGLNSAQSLITNATGNTLTLLAGSSINSGIATAAGKYGPTGLLTVTNNTGGLLAVANSTINTAVTSAGITPDWHVTGAATTLSMNGSIIGTAGFVKAGDGTLLFNAPQYYSATAGTQGTVINGGTLKLNGGNNTIQVAATLTVPTLVGLYANAGTFDLNGNNQAVERISSSNPNANTGGIITNTAAGAPVTLTTVTAAAVTFGGSINGNLNLTKYGNSAMTLVSPNSYTGATLIGTNTLTLRDAGTLANTTSVTLNYAGLNIDQSGLNAAGNLNPTRIAPSVPLTLRSGTLTLTGGGSVDSSTTFNTVNLAAGHNTLAVPQAPAGSTSTLSLGDLQVGADSTVTFNGGNSTGFFSGVLGLNNSQLFVGTINGAPIPANIPGKALGGWALANNGEFATYIQGGTTGANGVTWGISTLNNGTATAAGIAQAGYDVTTLPTTAVNTPLLTYRLAPANTPTQTLASGNNTINVLAIRAAMTLNFASSSDVLNLAGGGLAMTSGNSTIGNGILTAGDTQSTGIARLYIHSSAANIVNATIADNGAGAKTRLVANVIGSTLDLRGNNTYTGGTVVQGAGTLQLSGGGIIIPAGGLTLNNVAVTEIGNGGQIDPSTDVTINGGGVLTLASSNTLHTISFNNIGGAATPTVATGGSQLELTAANAVTSINDHFGTTPTLSGTGGLLLSDAAPVITTSGLSPNNLLISALISAPNGPVSKAGAGSLALSGQSTFTTGFNLNAGTLILGAATAGTPGALSAGPVGTGTLTIAGGTSIQSDATARTIANAVTVNGDFTFSGILTVNGVTLSGPVNFGGVTRTLTVTNPQVTSTISGQITNGTGGLTKAGAGGLILTPTLSLNTNTTAASPTVTLSSTAGLVVGQFLTGTGIPAGTYITNVDPDGVTLTLSQNATAAGSVAVNYGNTYTGPTTISGGILKMGNSAALSFNSNLTLNAGAVFDINGQATLLRAPVLNGLVTNSGAATSLTVSGLTPTDLTSALDLTINGVISNGANALSLVKAGAGNITFAGPTSTYTGSTTIRAGSMIAAVANTFSPSSAVILGNNVAGAGSTVGALDLGGFDQAIGGLTLQTDKTTDNVITVAAGKTLTINGGISVGINSGALPVTTTKLVFNGGGAVVVANQTAGTTIQIGGQTSGTGGSNATADFSGLASLNVSLNPTNSTIRVSNTTGAGTNVTGAGAFLKLAPVSSLTANTLTIGESGQNNGAAADIPTLTLGATSTTLNVNNLNIGTGARDVGQIVFPGPTGSLTIRNAAGTGGAVFNMGTGTANTGVLGNNTFDLRGHLADVQFAAVNIGTQPRSTTITDTLSFDQGTMTMASLTMATTTQTAESGNGAGTPRVQNAILNIGGGTASITGGIANLGQITGSGYTTASQPHTMNGTVNVSGGVVTIGANAGVAINMGTLAVTGATNVAALSSNGTLNLTGGTTTVQGDILFGGIAAGSTSTGALTASATLNVNGGTLDMSNKKIGGSLPANNLTSLTFAAGGLANVADINNGASLDKTTAGTLIVSGTNAYPGATNVNAGTLRSDGSIAASSGVTVAAGAKFQTGSTQTIKSLALTNGASAELASATLSVLTVGNNVNTTPFTLGGTASAVDMHKNVLIIDYPTGSSPIAAVKAGIAQSYNTGAWNGVGGIGSTEVTASVVTSPLLAVGYAEATSLIGGAGTVNFGGLTPTSATVDATSLIVRTTLSGDADLDGTVNLNDLIRLANNYGTTSGLNWSDGDFDYSGGVDLNDLIRLANNYGSTFAAGEIIPGASDSFQADLAAAFNGTAVPVGVPEPTTLGLAAVGAAGMLMRRRRRQA